MSSKDIRNLQPGATYLIQVVPKNYDGTKPVPSLVQTLTVPTTWSGSVISSNNTVVQNYLYASGAFVSGSTGGPNSPSSTMYIDGLGLHAFNSVGSSTVYISSQTGDAYFAGSVVSSYGSIAGWNLSPGLLFSGTASTYVGISSSGNDGWAFWAGSATASAAPFRVKNDGTIVAEKLTVSLASIGGWQIGTNNLYSGTGSNYVSLTSSGTYAIFAGNSTASSAPFRVLTDGTLIATNASVSGSITVSAGGTIGGFTIGTTDLHAGSGSNYVALSSSGGYAISAGSATASAAPFRVTDTGNLVATSASITGNINALSGSFTGNISATSGNLGGFTIGATALTASNIYISSTNGLAFGSSSAFKVDNAGNLTATSASLTGQITATSGSFTGSVTVSSGGALISGNTASGVVINSSGLYGYSNGITIFSIPTSPAASPTIAGFTIINTGITGSGSSANIIAGTLSNNVTLRGDKTGSQPAAIYNTASSNPTTAASGTGFYLDDVGNFRFASSSTNYISGSGGTLAVSGSIVASSGSIGAWLISSNALVGGSSSNTVGLVPNATAGGIAIYSGSSTASAAPFRVTNTGILTATGANISGSISASAGSFSGSITATSGSIGGWILSSSALSAGTGASAIGLISAPDSSSISIYAGSATASAAPFRVTNGGVLTASSANISGNIISASITSTSGSIGGWSLSSSALVGAGSSSSTTVGLISLPDSSSVSIYAGSSTASSAPFRVTWDGRVVATSASITGNINASSGSISGNFGVGTGGILYSGASASAGSRISMSASALTGYNSNGSVTFNLQATPAGVSNLILNPSFETGTTASWTSTVYPGSATWSANNTITKYGTWSAKAALPAGNYTSVLMSTPTAVTANKKYYVSGWIYSDTAFFNDASYGGVEYVGIGISSGSSVATASSTSGSFTYAAWTLYLNSGNWYNFNGVVTIPASHSFAAVGLVAGNSNVASKNVYFDFVEMYDYTLLTAGNVLGSIGGWSFTDSSIFTDNINLSNNTIQLQNNSILNMLDNSNLNIHSNSYSGTNSRIKFWDDAVGTGGLAQAQIAYNTSLSQLSINKPTNSTMTTIAFAAGAGGSVVVNNSHFAVDTNTLFVNSSTSRVGIGTSSPAYKLDVNGTGNFGNSLTVTTGGLTVTGTTLLNNALSVAGTASMAGNTTITGTSTLNGDVTINANLTITGATNLVSVQNSDFRVFSSGTSFTPFRIFNGSSGNASVVSPAIGNFATGAGTALVIDVNNVIRKTSSSLRTKKNIENYSPDLNSIMQLRPVLFNFNSQEDTDPRQAGFIAEEVEALGLKEFVVYDIDKKPESLNYGNMVAALLLVIKDQQKQLDNLSNKITSLEQGI